MGFSTPEGPATYPHPLDARAVRNRRADVRPRTAAGASWEGEKTETQKPAEVFGGLQAQYGD